MTETTENLSRLIALSHVRQLRRSENPYYSSDPDSAPNQKVADALLDGCTIVGYGRRQHGLHGKDADLDACGQCVVRGIRIDDPIRAESMLIRLAVRWYASICEPDSGDESVKAAAQEIVSSSDDYPGEWTGSDYWQFRHDAEVSVPLSLEEYESGADPENIKTLAARCEEAIRTHPDGIAFQRFAAELNESIAKLTH